MLALKRRTIWTISGSAIVGAVYGLVATLKLNADGLTFWDVIIPVVAGAALCAIIASAFSRMFQMGQLMHESQNRHSDNSLCYRGNRELLPASPASNLASHKTLVEGTLCYRGTLVSSPTSNSVSNQESQNSLFSSPLCYRGVQAASPISNCDSDAEIPCVPDKATLCYRGTPVSLTIPKSVLKRKSRNVAINGSLCYRGLTNTSPVSNDECENQPVEVTLIYRGNRYFLTRAVLEQPTVSRQAAVKVSQPATKLASS